MIISREMANLILEQSIIRNNDRQLITEEIVLDLGLYSIGQYWSSTGIDMIQPMQAQLYISPSNLRDYNGKKIYSIVAYTYYQNTANWALIPSGLTSIFIQNTANARQEPISNSIYNEINGNVFSSLPLTISEPMYVIYKAAGARPVSDTIIDANVIVRLRITYEP